MLMKKMFIVLALLAAPLAVFAQIETPDDLKVGDELPGPLGVYYGYTGENAGCVNVRLVSNRWRCYFLAADQKTIVEPEWPRAIIHYGNAVRKGLNKNTTVMTPAEGGAPYLIASRFIPPPDRYWIQLILQNKADVEATNNLNQPSSSDAKSQVFPTEILNQLTTQDAGDTDPTDTTNVGGTPTSP